MNAQRYRHDRHVKWYGIAILILFAEVVPVSADVAITVDDDGAADFATINGALAFAKANVPDGEKVVISVEEGMYEERLFIDRSDTCLIAKSKPRFDPDGYLAGFMNPVTVFVSGALPENEDVVRITADRVEFRGFIVWGGGVHPQYDNAGIKVTGHVTGTSVGEHIVRDVLVSACEVRGIADTPFWIAQAEVRIERCLKIDLSYGGIYASGADFALGPTPHVEIVKNLVANSGASVYLIGPVWEEGEGHNTHGDGGLSAVIEDNLLLDAIAGIEDIDPEFVFVDGHHLNLLLWGDNINSPQNAFGALDFVFRGNRLGASAGPVIKVRAGESAKQMATGLITGLFENNAFELGAIPETVGNFTMRLFELWYPGKTGKYVYNHAFMFADPDGLFSPDNVEIDEGPPNNGNVIIVTP